jgi:5-methylcytosine-specific restriction endonuclease McrA
MAVVLETIRAQVVAQAGGVCEYCRYPEEFNSGRFAVDHIRPRILGGTEELNNLALSCRSCNDLRPTNSLPLPLPKQRVRRKDVGAK